MPLNVLLDPALAPGTRKGHWQKTSETYIEQGVSRIMVGQRWFLSYDKCIMIM